MNMLMQLSLPLFVSPTKDAPPLQPILDTYSTTTTGIKVALKNPGDYHIDVKDIKAQLVGNKEAVLSQGAPKSKFMRILPHRQLNLDIPLDLQQCRIAEKIAVTLLVGKSTEPLVINLPTKALCK